MTAASGRLLTCAAAAFLLADCAEAGSRESTPLRVFVLPFLSHAGPLVADAEGYFAEQGISVEFVRMSDPAAAIPMLINGSLDVLAGGANPGLLNAMTRGLRVRAVADKGYNRVGNCSHTAIVLRKALAREGGPARVRRISIDKQPHQQYAAERMLASVGLQLKDLEVLHIPHVPELDALSRGTIDAAVATDPFLTNIVERGVAAPWIRLEDVLPNAQYSFLFFGPNLLHENPAAGRRFLIAYLKAVRQLEEGKTRHNLEVLARVTEEGADALQRMCWPSYHLDGHIDARNIADFQAWALERKLIDRVATAEEFVESSLVAQAYAALAQEVRHE
jgi:NitT/TauT family transport system substrate-binding protein